MLCGSTIKKETALDLATCPFVAFRTPIEQIRETMAANLGESTMSVADFERIKMPSGGIAVWTVPDIGGEKIMKELEAIVLTWHMVRLFWKLPREQSDGATPPIVTPGTRNGASATPVEIAAVVVTDSSAVPYKEADRHAN